MPRFVVMSPTESKAKEALRQIQFVMSKLGLVLHPEKTRMVELGRGRGRAVLFSWVVRSEEAKPLAESAAELYAAVAVT